MDQGSTVAAMGSDGSGDSGSGLLWGRQHRMVRARGRGAYAGQEHWAEEAGRRLTAGKAQGSVIGME